MNRMIQTNLGALSVLTALALTLPARTSAQDDPAHSAPLFLMTSASGKTMRLDIARTPLLARRIDVDLYGLSLGAALDTISARAGFRIAYNTDVVKRDSRVYLRANLITVAAALTTFAQARNERGQAVASSSGYLRVSEPSEPGSQLRSFSRRRSEA